MLRLVGKGRWRNVDRLRAVFGQAVQNRVEGWESALPIFDKQLLEMDKRSTAKADKVRPPPRFPIAHEICQPSDFTPSRKRSFVDIVETLPSNDPAIVLDVEDVAQLGVQRESLPHLWQE